MRAAVPFRNRYIKRKTLASIIRLNFIRQLLANPGN